MVSYSRVTFRCARVRGSQGHSRRKRSRVKRDRLCEFGASRNMDRLTTMMAEEPCQPVTPEVPLYMFSTNQWRERHGATTLEVRLMLRAFGIHEEALVKRILRAVLPFAIPHPLAQCVLEVLERTPDPITHLDSAAAAVSRLRCC